MAKNDKTEDKEQKNVAKLGDFFNKNVNKISSQITGSTLSNDSTLDDMNARIDKVIFNELKQTKSITSDDMSTFLVKLFNDFDTTNSDNFKGRELKDIFEDESAGLFQFFQQRYQNQNLLYEDLELISSQLFELDEAIMTTRDSIVTSEDISSDIAKTMKFDCVTELDDATCSSYIKMIKKMEDKYNLNTKIKNILIPNVLRYGKFYVYAVPYAKLFEEQYNKKMDDPTSQWTSSSGKQKKKTDYSKPGNYSSSLSESVNIDTLTTDIKASLNKMYEGYSRQPETGNDSHNKKSDAKSPAFNMDDKKLSSIITEYAKDINVVNNTISIPLVEGVDVSELLSSDEFNKTKEKTIKDIQKSMDGTVDPNKKRKVEFDGVTGCYVKFIEPKKLIPIKVLDTIIGYYYINGTDFQVNKSPFSTTIRLTSMNSMMAQNMEDVESMFLSSITDKIVSAFDKPFLEKNTQFKDLILNALLYNDMYKRRITFQYIPAEYIQEFNINPDENGDGQSAISKALFYAKLYLSLLIFKMISIITKSNDTRVYYVRNSGIDSNITNKVQEVARSIKGRQINFMDLLNYNSIISKIGAYKELFVPVGRSGEKGIDFDILSGQDVQLNTDLMEMLRTNMINGTGVPSVIMNYINEADYAKTLTMANSKFIGRVISYQLDLNKSITELYKKLIKYSSLEIPAEILDGFEYTFNPPRSLNNINLSDMIGNIDSVINAIIKSFTGEYANQDDNDINMLKDEMYKKLLRQYVPAVDWNMVDEVYKDAKLEVTKRKEEMESKKKIADSMNNEESGEEDYSSSDEY